MKKGREGGRGREGPGDAERRSLDEGASRQNEMLSFQKSLGHISGHSIHGQLGIKVEKN